MESNKNAKRWAINPKMKAQVLTDDEVKALHRTSVKVFEEIGIRVESIEAAKIYESGGATVEYQDNIAFVKIPEKMIDECLAATPKWPVFHGRIPESDYYTGKDEVTLTVFGECVTAKDPVTGEVRESHKEDLGNMTRFCDYYDDVAFVERSCGSLDKPAETESLHNLDIMMQNTSKPVFLAAMKRENCKKMIEMGYIAAGGEDKFRARPFVNIFVCPVSPLTMGKDASEIIIEAARGGAGIAIIPMGLMSATAPATIAGTVVETNVDVLASIILAQLVNKGTRCFYCSMTTIMDLKKMIAAVGAPEHGLISASAVKLAQYYELPSCVGCGVSDSKATDAQAGVEFTANAFTAAISGANVIFAAGALEYCLLVDYAKMVIDCEAFSFIRRIIQGVEVNEDTLAFDTMKAVGPSGEFLGQKHTRAHMREMVIPTLFDRNTREAWEAAGSLTIEKVAAKRAQEILATHKVAPLPEGAQEQIDKLIADYEKELGVAQ
ncbi:MAG: trimethylamine methyltransferase family protein [Clostridiales Family XIII bacterium]|jgi:trimethylamine--corrinoid protein Co-methyltransferase|nr:trimethylamine methyltransferase family protein [Clostridiales Family XIII bacterium]